MGGVTLVRRLLKGPPYYLKDARLMRRLIFNQSAVVVVVGWVRLVGGNLLVGRPLKDPPLKMLG